MANKLKGGFMSEESKKTLRNVYRDLGSEMGTPQYPKRFSLSDFIFCIYMYVLQCILCL